MWPENLNRLIDEHTCITTIIPSLRASCHSLWSRNTVAHSTTTEKCQYIWSVVSVSHITNFTEELHFKWRGPQMYWLATRYKICHFGHLLSQSLGYTEKTNPNIAKAVNTGWSKNIQNAKPKNTKRNINLRTADVCVHHCAQLSYTTQHRTVLICLQSSPPDKHSCSLDAIYWMREGPLQSDFLSDS